MKRMFNRVWIADAQSLNHWLSVIENYDTWFDPKRPYPIDIRRSSSGFKFLFIEPLILDKNVILFLENNQMYGTKSFREIIYLLGEDEGIALIQSYVSSKFDSESSQARLFGEIINVFRIFGTEAGIEYFERRSEESFRH